MKKNILSLIMAGFMVMALSSLSMAKGFGGGHGPGHKGRFHIFDQLDLTDDQQTKIDKIRETYRSQAEAQMENMASAMEALNAAIHAETFDESAVRAASQGVSAIREEMDVIRAKETSEIRSVLTAEQIATWDELRAERLERMKERLENGMPDSDI